MELTQQEVFALIGELQLQIAAQRKHIASLEAQLKEREHKIIPIKEAGT